MNVPITIDGHLDWVSATLIDQETAFNIIPPLRGVGIGEKIKPPRRFDKAWSIYPAGMVAIQKAGKRTSMLWLTGKDLEVWRQTGIDSQSLVDSLQDMRVRATRLDFCINVHNGGKVRHAVNHLEAGKRTGRPKPYAEIRGYHNRGDTLYFGSPSSAQRVTIYDKAKQLKLADEMWIRIEARIRKQKARPLLADMASYGVGIAGKQRIRELVDFPGLRWYQMAVTGPVVELSKVPRRQSDLLKWLQEQVMPTFEKEHDTQTTIALMDWLHDAQANLIDTHNRRADGMG